MLFTSLMVTSMKKTHNRYTKNKKQETKSYHQRKLLSVKEKKEVREVYKTTRKQITKWKK